LQILVCGVACAICKCVQCALAPQLPIRAKARGQNKIFIGAVIFLLLVYLSSINGSVSLFNLAGNGRV